MSTVCVITETFCEYEGTDQLNMVVNVIGVAGNPTIAENLISERIGILKKNMGEPDATVMETPDERGYIMEFKYSGLVETYAWRIEDFEIIGS